MSRTISSYRHHVMAALPHRFAMRTPTPRKRPIAPSSRKMDVRMEAGVPPATRAAEAADAVGRAASCSLVLHRGLCDDDDGAMGT